MPDTAYPYVYRWRNNPVRAAFYGRRCRMLVRGKLNTCLIEFEGGEQTITSRNAVMKAKEG